LKELFFIQNTFGKAKTLILDHVLLCSWIGENYNLVDMGNESDHYNLSFEFKHLVPGGEYASDDEEEWSSKGIKGCGVFPVYGLEHSGVEINELSHESEIDESEIDENVEDESESDRVGIVELQFTFSAQNSHESDQHLKFDIDDSQNQSSTDEIEDGQQQIIPRKEKEALRMRMKLKLEALQMKMKMNIKKLIFPRNKRGGLE
jgi:hypothetical protein